MSGSAGIALRTAVFGIIGFSLAQISASLILLAIWHAFHGDLGALPLTPVAGVTFVLAAIAIRETAIGLRGG